MLPARGTVTRVLAVTGMDRSIPCFTSLDQALAACLPGMLKASVTAGESGLVITLAGEADLTTAEQLKTLITGQLAGGTRQLTMDVSRLRFADSATVQTLVLAAKALKERGGTLILLDPQQPVAQMLALTGADQMLTILHKPRSTRGPQISEAADP